MDGIKIQNSILHGDCIEVMPAIPDKCIDMILCDLPYGITANKLDIIIPFESLWNQYERIIKDNGAIVLTASQPFTSVLIMSNLRLFKYTWVWNKINRISNHLNANKQPLRITEDVCIFYKRQPTYNPQMNHWDPYVSISSGNKSVNYGKQKDKVKTVNNGKYYPVNLISIKADNRKYEGRLHPNQKSIAFLQYFIQTYTNEDDLILDNCCGSGSTGVAAYYLKRRCIMIDKDKKCCTIAEWRLKEINDEILL